VATPLPFPGGVIGADGAAASGGASQSVRDATLADAAHVVLSSVQKSYGEIEAIRDASFALTAGEFVSVLGPSGCGKSTLLMMIAGLISPSAGEITVGGSQIRGPRREIGIAFQSPVLLPWRSIIDNVLFPIEMLKLPRRTFLPRAIELLEMAKIGEFARRLPRELSGGMRQRAAICRALIHDPTLLLMDEPFSALDAMTRDEMGLELLRIWQANRKSVLFVTHSIREAAFLSDRVLVMGRRPASMIAEIRIDTPRPRRLEMMEHPDFNAYVRELRNAIEASHAA
jgi:NitT/TauT family transport system ATP-binding protein